MAVLACAASCIYPYEAELEEQGLGGNLVVEGDIIIGSKSNFALSTLIPMGENTPSMQPSGDLWVENDAGGRYEGVQVAPGEYEVDLAGAPADAAYRLCITAIVSKTCPARSYCSSWSKSAGDCIIDKLESGFYYSKPEHVEGDKPLGVEISMSLHSEQNNKHFRYRYVEDWEYTAQERAIYYYDPAVTEEHPGGNVVRYEGDENTYYCWKKAMSRGINLATTETMGVNSLEDYPLFRYTKNDDRLSVLYRLRMEVYAISQESYRYLEHVKQMSEYDGSLFAPMPSEVRGNIRCTTDDDEIVYGYVGVAYPAIRELWLKADDMMIYERAEYDRTEPEILDESSWRFYYNNKIWRPYRLDPIAGLMWLPARCVDCRYGGGNKNRPENWPNSHQ